MKRTILLVAIVVLGAMTGMVPVAAAQDATGHWEGKVSTPAGELPFALDVSRSAAGLVGSIDSPATGDRTPLKVVTQSGVTLHFEMPLDDLVLPFDATLDGAIMTGAVHGPGGTYSFTARRLSKPEPKYTEVEFTIQSAGATLDRKSTRLNSSHIQKSRMPSSA